MEGRERTQRSEEMENRQSDGNTENTEENKELDENGNPTCSVYPIMNPQIRPLSIYRHTPVFKPKKLTVPSMVNDHETMGSCGGQGSNNGDRDGSGGQGAKTLEGRERGKSGEKSKKRR